MVCWSAVLVWGGGWLCEQYQSSTRVVAEQYQSSLFLVLCSFRTGERAGGGGPRAPAGMPSAVVPVSGHTVCQAVERLGHTSRFFCEDERREAHLLAAIVTDLLGDQARELLRDARQRNAPVLLAYMSDGWSTSISTTRTVPTDLVATQRVAHFRAEFLAEKTVLKTVDAAGCVKQVLLVKPPRRMDGKTGWDIFRASLTERFLRLELPLCICISFYLQDGLHAKSLVRWQRARHELHYDLMDEGEEQPGTFAARRMDWVFGLRCVAHVASSALKWGLAAVASEEIIDGAHLVMKSCRNSSDPLHRFIPAHVLKRVLYEDPDECTERRAFFWTAFGVPANQLDFVLRVDPRWHFGRERLLVRAELQHDPHGIQLVEDVVAYFLQWRNWSDTRWAGVGPAARLFMTSMFVGIEALVSDVVEHGVNNEKYYIGAADRMLSIDVKRYLAVAALAAYPVESFTLGILEDDRFLLRARELWGGVNMELDYVSHFPRLLWVYLASAVGDPALDFHDMRSMVIEAARVSIAYLDRNLYSPLREKPLSLTQGDMDHNLEELRARDVTGDDDLTKKIHFCMHLCAHQCKQAMRLVLDAPCSIALVEKGHAAGAFVKRFHRTLGQAQLELRAFLNEVRPLFRMSPEQARSLKLQRDLERLLTQARLVRFSGRNLLASRLLEHARATTAGAAVPGQELSRRVVVAHNRLWHELRPDHQALLVCEAERLRQLKAQDYLEEARHVHAALALHRTRVEAPNPWATGWRAEGLPCTVEHFRFATADLDRFAAGIAGASPASSGNWASIAHHSDLPAVELHEKALLERRGAELEPAAPAQPWWLPVLVTNRAAFAGTCLACRGDEEDDSWPQEVFVLALAVQRPYAAHFLRGTLRPPTLEGPGLSADIDNRAFWGYYDCDMECLDAADTGLGDDDCILVLPGLVHVAGAVLAPAHGVPFEDFCQSFVIREARRGWPPAGGGQETPAASWRARPAPGGLPLAHARRPRPRGPSSHPAASSRRRARRSGSRGTPCPGGRGLRGRGTARFAGGPGGRAGAVGVRGRRCGDALLHAPGGRAVDPEVPRGCHRCGALQGEGAHERVLRDLPVAQVQGLPLHHPRPGRRQRAGPRVVPQGALLLHDLGGVRGRGGVP